MSRAARQAYLRACRLDVAVRKPGNVSFASGGHGMQAELFLRSAEATAGPLFERGARVGDRIEQAVAATWRAVGCNTNLGIVLLCAPLAAALEVDASPPGLRAATASVLQGLDVADAAAAFRAIAMANPAGLGRVDSADVREAPTLDLLAAMRLAAGRDRIAAQYDHGYADVFGIGLGALPAAFDPRDEAYDAAVQRLFVTLLAAFEDSHIVRKHGSAVAHSVMRAAQARLASAAGMEAQALAQWDEKLKSEGVNPGTSADLVVATLFVAGLVAQAREWHGT